MDLEEMKNIWQQHERELKQNRLLNERIISDMLKQRSASAMKKMTGAEYLGAALCAALLLIFVPMGGQLEGTGLMISYAFTLLFIAASLVFSLYKVSYLSKTDLGKPVTETVGRISRFRLLIAKERAWSIALFPVVIVTVFAVVSYWINGVNLFDNITPHLPKILIGVAVGIPVALVVYQRVYMSSIRQITDNLKELEEFTSIEN
ncbi:hypothetical protein [Polluticoccus soli]|uniref:hypothetical protein n=1 Tax=Polluticoccus soli TaxID=3034150 RepID=UPI0023E202DF|nr:hypothetical protein [Flavipsychrobacter sp. JY13-12]